MTKKELKDAFRKLRMTQRDFAKEINRSESAVSDWFTGEQLVPEYVSVLVNHKLALQRLSQGLHSMQSDIKLVLHEKTPCA